MAIGLLGTGSAGASSGSVVVYTVPSGISHAVVHVTAWNTGTIGTTGCIVRVNNVPFLTPRGDTGGWTSNSVSMMLSPGDDITVEGSGPGVSYCTVSGYEVD